jgi:coenzyme F420 hydrogenase subunit delta
VLFDLVLSERRPRKIIIVDAMDKGLPPGELFRPTIEAVPLKKLDDFSMHQLPGSNLVRELRDSCGVDVEVIACQVQHIPESVSPGLSPPIEAAIPRAAEMILKEYEALTTKLSATSAGAG